MAFETHSGLLVGRLQIGPPICRQSRAEQSRAQSQQEGLAHRSSESYLKLAMALNASSRCIKKPRCVLHRHSTIQ